MSPEMTTELSILFKEINKKYGANSIVKITEPPIFDPENVISSGSIALNTALGIGGFPKGRIIEIFGPESSGKTTLTLQAAIEAQKFGEVAFIDTEHALDMTYAKNLGVDLTKFSISQPSTAEEALEIADLCVKTGVFSLIIIDSVSGLVPQKELEGDMGDSSIGVVARLMSQAMRKLVGNCARTKTSMIWINQIRHKIGVMYGSSETTSGGNALKFYSSVRLDIRKTGVIKDVKDGISGNTTRVKVVKNKMAPPYKEAEFNILFGKGIDLNGELLELAVEDKIIEKSGPGWYKYEGNSIAQGATNCANWLNENPEIKDKIKKEILANRGMD